MDLRDLVIRTADDRDVEALTTLRSLWSPGADELDFEQRMAAWLAAEGERRTIWLAALPDLPIGMASVFEYRRMPRPDRTDSRWGYVSNMFVREEFRNRGVGSTEETRTWMHAFSEILTSPPCIEILRFEETKG